MAKMIYILILMCMCLIGLASTEVEVGYDADVDSGYGVNIKEEIRAFDNATGGVNRSDFWDNLDTPADIIGYNFWYNQTGAYGDYVISSLTADSVSTNAFVGIAGGSIDTTANPWILNIGFQASDLFATNIETDNLEATNLNVTNINATNINATQIMAWQPVTGPPAGLFVTESGIYVKLADNAGPAIEASGDIEQVGGDTLQVARYIKDFTGAYILDTWAIPWTLNTGFQATNLIATNVNATNINVTNIKSVTIGTTDLNATTINVTKLGIGGAAPTESQWAVDMPVTNQYIKTPWGIYGSSGGGHAVYSNNFYILNSVYHYAKTHTHLGYAGVVNRFVGNWQGSNIMFYADYVGGGTTADDSFTPELRMEIVGLSGEGLYYGNWNVTGNLNVSGDGLIGDDLVIGDDLTVNDLLNLVETTIGSCDVTTNGSIVRNVTGTYGCSHNSLWTKLY